MRKLRNLILLAAVVLLAACDPNGASFTLSPNVLQLKPGDMQTVRLKLLVRPPT